MRRWPWDDGVRWFARRTVAATEPPMEVGSYVQEEYLRDMADGAQQFTIGRMVAAAVSAAEDATGRALMPQTWAMTLDRFPGSGEIHAVRPPFIEALSLAYYDTDNAAQELLLSPEEFLVIPSGAETRAIVRPLDGEEFPETYCRPDAVTLTFRAGYADQDDPVLQQINAGILLMVGELYKQRSLSVQSVHNDPSLLTLARFWRPV